jgi:hypothetical protein
MEILNINQKFTAENYPYSGKRTAAYFSVNFNDKKGFRTEFQTINPSNNILNKVKNSTYSNFICLVREDNGHYDWKLFSVNGDEATIKTFMFIAENYDALDMKPSMHQYLMANAMMSRSIGLSFTKLDTEEAKEEYKRNYHTPFLQKAKESLTMPHPSTYKEMAELLKAGIEFEKSHKVTSSLD